MSTFDIDQALLLIEVQAGTTKPPHSRVIMGVASDDYDSGTRIVSVTIDGDTVPTPVKSTVGAITVGQRVVVEFYEPHGIRIVGTF